MKLIRLTKGQFAKVDDEDFNRFGHMKWCAIRHKSTKSFYARHYCGGGRKNPKFEYLHQAIMGPCGSNFKIDHINHDSLDCQRSNLRIVSNAQNSMNRSGPNKNNTSGYRGVTWDKKNNKWMSQIYVDGKNIKLGRFSSLNRAAVAYAYANAKHFGVFGGNL